MKNSKNYYRNMQSNYYKEITSKFYNDIMYYFCENVVYEDEKERKAFEDAMEGVLKDVK